MLFKIWAGNMYCGVLAVGGIYGHTFYSVSTIQYRRRNRVAKIAGYKHLKLEKI